MRNSDLSIGEPINVRFPFKVNERVGAGVQSLLGMPTAETGVPAATSWLGFQFQTPASAHPREYLGPYFAEMVTHFPYSVPAQPSMLWAFGVRRTDDFPLSL